LQTVHHACLLASVHSQPGASEQKRSNSGSSTEQCKQSEQYKRTLISLDCKATATAIHWRRRQVYTHTPLQITSLKHIYSAVLLLLHTNQPPTEYARKNSTVVVVVTRRTGRHVSLSLTSLQLCIVLQKMRVRMTPLRLSSCAMSASRFRTCPVASFLASSGGPLQSINTCLWSVLVLWLLLWLLFAVVDVVCLQCYYSAC
jgi:hypothetical protein